MASTKDREMLLKANEAERNGDTAEANRLREQVKRNRAARTRRSIMDEVADACGLKKVRGARTGRIYYE